MEDEEVEPVSDGADEEPKTPLARGTAELRRLMHQACEAAGLPSDTHDSADGDCPLARRLWRVGDLAGPSAEDAARRVLRAAGVPHPERPVIASGQATHWRGHPETAEDRFANASLDLAQVDCEWCLRRAAMDGEAAVQELREERDAARSEAYAAVGERDAQRQRVVDLEGQRDAAFQDRAALGMRATSAEDAVRRLRTQLDDARRARDEARVDLRRLEDQPHPPPPPWVGPLLAWLEGGAAVLDLAGADVPDRLREVIEAYFDSSPQRAERAERAAPRAKLRTYWRVEAGDKVPAMIAKGWRAEHLTWSTAQGEGSGDDRVLVLWVKP